MYWGGDAQFAILASRWPCPWCGGEAKKEFPPQGAVIADGEWICFQKLGPDGTVPGFPGQEGQTVTIHHMTGNVCCEHPDIGPDK